MKRLVATLFLTLCCGLIHAEDAIRVFKTKGQFDDVKANIVTAIEGQGLVINTTSYISDMLHRTGGDIGNSTPIYGQAEIFEFCSASASRTMMAADPKNMAFCPYAISVYTLPGKSNEVFVAHRPLPDLPPFKAAREIIDGILREALN